MRGHESRRRYSAPGAATEKAAVKRTAIVAASLALALWCALAQAPRDAYRSAYRNWRQSDPNLERDAGAGGPPVAQRAEQMAAQAQNYGVERGAYLQALADDTQRSLSWLESPAAAPLPDVTKAAAARVTVEMAAVKRNIDTYANDPDAGIQRVRALLEREAEALAALNNSMLERQNMADAAKAATAAASIAQSTALEKDRELIAGLKLAPGDADRERAAWAEYYRIVADAARVPESVPAPASPTPAPVFQPATGATTATTPLEPPAARPVPVPPASTEPAKPAPATSEAAAPAPSPETAPRAPSITPIPLIRYTGAWTYQQSNGMYHGLQPEAIEFDCAEDNGHASGTLAARFKLPGGSTDDPVVRLTFSGDFSNHRNQVFELQTPEGAKGRIELIPGTAFNLLEINFLIEAGPGKIRQGNAVLIKK
jgi:hypothetical protein